MGTYDKNNVTLKIVEVLKKLYKDNNHPHESQKPNSIDLKS